MKVKKIQGSMLILILKKDNNKQQNDEYEEYKIEINLS